MPLRIIRIAAALAGALLLAGCSVQLDPAQEEIPISFSAGSQLLRNDASTKGTTDSFTSNSDTFTVFGEKVTSADVHTLVFNGVTVNHHVVSEGSPEGYWDYDIHHFWNWVSPSDRYDFVAVSPAGMGTTNENAVDNLSVSTHYDYLTGAPSGGNKQDILAATYRRTGSDWDRRHDQVSLSFSHMGSAVGVEIVNNSQSTYVTFTSIHYENLVVSADAKVSMDNYGRTVLRWTNFTPSATAVRRLAKEPATTIPPTDRYTGEYQIMIPQNLNLYEQTLVLNYKIGDSVQEPARIPLNTITREDGTPITSWDIGCKYTYSISMRLDGGLLVTVSTTPWDVPVAGETPGILI